MCFFVYLNISRIMKNVKDIKAESTISDRMRSVEGSIEITKRSTVNSKPAKSLEDINKMTKEFEKISAE